MGAIQNAVNSALSAGAKATAVPAAGKAVKGISSDITSAISDSYEAQEGANPHSVIDFNEDNPFLSKSGARTMSTFSQDERVRLLHLAQKASIENAIDVMESYGGIKVVPGKWLDAYRKSIAANKAPGGKR